MRPAAHRRNPRALTLVGLLIAIGLLGVLAGIASHVFLAAKNQSEIVILVNRAGQLGTALQLYYQQKRLFPGAHPAHLETDLAAYVDQAEFFTSRASPEAGAEPINLSYVAPLGGDGNRYVLGLCSKYEDDRCVVLYADGLVEAAAKLTVRCNDQVTPSASLVKGGTIAFETGSLVELTGGTTVALGLSFRAGDGTPIHVLKQNEPEPGGMTVTAVGADIVEVASPAALALTRTGASEIEFLSEEGEEQMKVLATCGEVVVDGRRIGSTDGGGGTSGEGQNLAGTVSLNPSNSPDFEFVLKTSGGTWITRDDLLGSDGGLVYSGGVVLIRFRPRASSDQNTLYYNGKVYPVRNGRYYTVTGSTMQVQLYSDQPGAEDGTGRWSLTDFFATDAQIVDSGPGRGKKTGQTGGDSTDEPTPEASGADGDPSASGPRSIRSLGRGSTVPEGQRTAFRAYK